PGLYAEAALADDRDAAFELLFLIAYLQPIETDDPFAGIAAARDGAPLDGVPLGPRTAHDPARGDRTLAAYRAWAERSGRRAAALAEAAQVPLAALDLALWNWETPGRAHGGVPGDAEDPEVRARIERALGL